MSGMLQCNIQEKEGEGYVGISSCQHTKSRSNKIQRAKL